MRSKSHISMCRDHRDSGSGIPDSVRISRPLRDLLAAGEDGLRNTARHAWEIAKAGGGRWTKAEPSRLLGAGRNARVHQIELRTRDGNHLDLTMLFEGEYGAIAIGRRVIVIAPTVPETILTAAVGQPLSRLVDAPFLADQAIVVQRTIRRAGETYVDLRCRCPSHVVDLRIDDHAGADG